jgi:hypothetical protein
LCPSTNDENGIRVLALAVPVKQEIECPKDCQEFIVGSPPKSIVPNEIGIFYIITLK